MRKALFHVITMLLPLFGIGQTVKIGDILCTDGSTVRPEQFASSGRTADGIVFYVDETGTHGWAVSLDIDALDTDWVTEAHYSDGYDIPDLPNCEYSRQALYDMDGYQNTAIIRNAHGPDWYPAAWAVDFDNGWYLPAAGQMRWLLAYVNEINASLAMVNGDPFVLPYPDWHWTSTEYSGMHAVIVSRLGSVSNYMKWNYYTTYTIGVRAIKDFECNSTPEHKIGDVITAPGGQTGIVFYVSPDDGSYWLTALNDLPESYKWGNDEDIPGLDNIADNASQWYRMQGIYCGYDATRQMRDAQGNNNAYAAQHVDIENGWHIPSTGQLSKLYAALPHIEEALLESGGSLPSGDLYWTSTENSNSQAWAIDFGSNEHLYQEGRFVATPKQTQCKVRSIWSQSCENIILPSVGSITSPEAICANESLILQIPEVEFADAQGWQLSETSDFSHPFAYDGGPLGAEYDGWFLRYFVSNLYGTVYSNTVNIVVWPIYTTSFQARACTAYDWEGTTYTESGVYTQNLTTLQGCDSIVTMHLTIIGTLTHEWSIEACDRYTWNGITYTEPGDHVQELVTPEGCDSIVTLHLSFSDALEVDADTTACGSFSWNGHDFTESGVYDSTYITPGGCDSLVHLHFTVMPYPEAVGAIEGMQEVYVCTDLISGLYHYRIDSVEFATRYEWELEGADWPMDTSGLYCDLWVTTPGDVILRAKAWNGCGYTEREILIHAGFFDINENPGIKAVLYPNPAQDKVTIEAEDITRVRIFDLQGRLIKEQASERTDRLDISLQGLVPALYTVEIQTIRGCSRLKLSLIP